ncbi:MAG: nucleoside hydrolase [Erysipelothrix sp.]|nr:nucleoside hydrolase [Erysipelothrix sp.]
MEKEIVVIDCDPGIDDAYALLYALADKNLDVRLVSTVSGNVNVDVNTKNAQRIVKMANKNIPIVKGATRPLVKAAHYAEHVHGKNGMNNYIYKNDEMAELLEISVLKAYYQVISKAEKPVIIAAIGPLTNIAKLLLTYPDIKNKIKYLTIMGGGLKGGNTTIAAEFNFYADPEAAKIVLESGLPIIMAGLDVTEKTIVSQKLLEDLKALNPIGEFLYDILDPKSSYMQIDKGSLHDVVALMAINNLDIFSFENLDVYVETNEGLTRGMSVADRRMNSKNGKVKVLVDVDIKRFNQELINKIKSYK